MPSCGVESANRECRWLWLAPLAAAAFFLFTRPWLASSLELDEAEQFVFAQKLAWGYSEQPPLFTWLVWTAFFLFGVNVLALTLVKSAAIFVMLWSTAHCLALLKLPPRIAATGSLSVLLCPFFAWEASFSYTHTFLACAFFAATLWQALAMLECAKPRDYLLLGVLLGLGTISKYLFVLYAGVLGMAALSVPGARRALLRSGMLLSLVSASAVILPHAIWVLENHIAIRLVLQQRTGFMVHDLDPSTLAIVWQYAINLISIAAPVLSAGWIFAPGAWRFGRAVDLNSGNDSGVPSVQSLHLVQRTLAGALAVFLVMILAGLNAIHNHWLAPVVLLATLTVLGRLALVRPAWKPGRLAVLVLLALATVACVRFGGFAATGRRDRDWYFSAAQDALRQAGLSNRSLLAESVLTAGNLRRLDPKRAVGCVYRPLFNAIDASEAPLLVWNASQYAEPAHAFVERGWIHGPRASWNARLRYFELGADRDPRYRRLAVFEPSKGSAQVVAASGTSW